jgi:hypothetical protein
LDGWVGANAVILPFSVFLTMLRLASLSAAE